MERDDYKMASCFLVLAWAAAPAGGAPAPPLFPALPLPADSRVDTYLRPHTHPPKRSSNNHLAGGAAPAGGRCPHPQRRNITSTALHRGSLVTPQQYALSNSAPEQPSTPSMQRSGRA